jgi:hypothetical protein
MSGSAASPLPTGVSASAAALVDSGALPKGFSQGPSTRRPGGIPLGPKVGLFIDRIPSAIRTLIGKSTLGDQNMDWWRTHPAYKKPANSGLLADWARYVIDFDELKNWKKSDQCKGSPPAFATDWLHQSQGPKDTFQQMMREVYLSKPPGSRGGWLFPDPAIPETPGPIGHPSRNDKAWADQLEKARIGTVGDGTLLVSTDDPLSLSIGRFNWAYFPVGDADLRPGPKAPNLYFITVRKVGVYAIDKYEFTNDGRYDQYLGDWNVDAGSEGIRGKILTGIDFVTSQIQSGPLVSDAGYYPPMGYQTVTNNCFDRYRTETGNGCDFMVLSNVKYFDVNIGFSIDMDRI